MPGRGEGARAGERAPGRAIGVVTRGAAAGRIGARGVVGRRTGARTAGRATGRVLLAAPPSWSAGGTASSAEKKEPISSCWFDSILLIDSGD